MRGYSEFKGYRTRLAYDAQSERFVEQRMPGPMVDSVVGGQAPDASAETVHAEQLTPNAAEPLQHPPAKSRVEERPARARPTRTRFISPRNGDAADVRGM